MLSKITILNAISEKKASDIFKSVASTYMNTDILITQLKLTRKQYYSRMSRLIKAGLVKRQKGRYLLTEFGKVIYTAHVNLEAMIEISQQLLETQGHRFTGDFFKTRAERHCFCINKQPRN